MLDDENDKIIKEAAEHYHPGYDDKAWEKMEQLLDEHLPQKKERKKIIFILPSLLLVGILMFFIVMNNKKSESSNTVENLALKNNIEKSLVEKISPPKNESAKNFLSSKEHKNENHSITIAQKVNPTSENLIHQSENDNHFHTDLTANKNELKQQPVSKPDYQNGKNTANFSADLKSETENKSEPETFANENNSAVPKTGDENNLTKNEIEKSKKTPSGFINNFGVSISAGPDISGVHANKIGRLTGIFGVGLNYTVSKNFSIRSGFYISKKIYSVDGNDYNLQGGNTGYGYLENVDANCMVYEIPLKIDYNFKSLKNHSWFISTGLSSYLMKKENYDYYYKTPAGQLYNKDYTINNKNKHFFSVVSFSAGYQYYLNNQFSIAAEPYINLPLKGIGEGKVKLNSGGILLTLKMKPFLNNEK
ncbi:MAG: hypothetical protein ACTHM5_09465 [Ginsengibacter sp.]